MKLPTVLLPLAFCIGLTACGGGGGGGSDSGGSEPASLRFAEDTMLIPIADARVDQFIANFSALQSNLPDDDLTGTWLFLSVEAGADQLVDKDPAKQTAPLAVSSYVDSFVVVLSLEERNGILKVFQCGAGGWEDAEIDAYQITRDSSGNKVILKDVDSSFDYTPEATARNNKVLRFSGENNRGTRHSEDNFRKLHYYTTATAVAYVKVSSQMNAVIGTYSDAFRDGDLVACAMSGQYESMTGMNPATGSRTYISASSTLTYYVDGLTVYDMPQEEYQWLDTLPGRFRLEQEGRVGDLQILVE